jgi:hypothetical protein
MAKKATTAADPVKLGWHFLPADRKLTYSDNRKVEVGKTLSVGGAPMTCSRGLHASEQITQAASFSRGPVLTRVEVWGNLAVDDNKFCGNNRKALWMGVLTIQDIKDCLKSVGYRPSGYVKTIDEYVAELANAASDEEDLVEAWLETWAARHGCPGAKVHQIEPVVMKPEMTATILRSFLSDRIVFTRPELDAIIGDTYDEDTVDSAFEDLIDESGVCVVECYANNGYDEGYVLARKATKRKR